MPDADRRQHKNPSAALRPQPPPVSPPKDSNWYASSHVAKASPHMDRRCFNNLKTLSSSPHPSKIIVRDCLLSEKDRPLDEVFPEFVSGCVRPSRYPRGPYPVLKSSTDLRWYISRKIWIMDPIFDNLIGSKVNGDFYRSHSFLLNRNLRIEAVINRGATLDDWTNKFVDLFKCSKSVNITASGKIFRISGVRSNPHRLQEH